MDPLQEAIEKARREREGKIGRTSGLEEHDDRQAPTEAAVDDTAVEADAPGTTIDPPPQTPSAVGAVTYSSTRSVTLNPKTLAKNRVISGDKYDSRAEAYRQLRAQVLQEMKQNNWTTLAITSAHQNAGKTLTAVNLAICIAQEVSQTVMLVDLDLRTPDVHLTLGLEPEKGIVDHLVYGASLSEVLINPGLPRLVILPCIAQEEHSSELLSSPEMKAFLSDITNRYTDRLIIFDLPPLLRNDDAMTFLPFTDASIMVVEDAVTTAHDLERSIQLMQNTNIIGTVLNKAL